MNNTVKIEPEALPNLLECLAPLEDAVKELASTWRPDDPEYRANLYRQVLMNFSFAYFAFFHADPAHPDWAPLWNPVYLLQPNPDDIYLYCPIRGDLTYRVQGHRGTARMLTFNTQRGLPGFFDSTANMGHYNDFDDRKLTIGADGQFEVLFSVERPKEYKGNWAPIAREADLMMVRYRSYDWAREVDPQLTIECVTPMPLKLALTPAEIMERIRRMALFPGYAMKVYFGLQNGIRQRVGVNVFEPVSYPIGLGKQVYWPAVFELDEGEALIVETELPKIAPYWNIQLNDPLFNAIEYVYRLSSLNGASAKVSSDGKFRAVIALEDPGVPNWLDPVGFKQGTIYGRWYDCDTSPLPVIKRVSLADLRKHLPPDTPVVSPQERRREIQDRVKAAQRRRRW
jgi:hypothetical protein